MASRQVHTFPPSHAEDRLRMAAAAALRAASVALALLARQLARRAQRDETAAAVLEFHAEAGAPEGALYVDGKLVGHLRGVQRL